MGRPGKIKPTRSGTSRRGFFQATGSAAAALAAAPMFGLGQAGAVAGVFQHGVASGDPLPDRVILWTRVSLASSKTILVTYIVATDPGLRKVVLRGTATAAAASDFTVKVDAGLLRRGDTKGVLRPNTTYYYQFTAGGQTSPIGRTKTLPVGPTQSLRFAVVSCSNYAYGYFNAYGRIAARADLDLVMHLGDYIYEYGSGYGTARAYAPPNALLTLTDYRTRHAQYKGDPDSIQMHRQHPLVAIWDDHETANNSWRDGAENHDPATEGLWADRVNAALQAYYEWMPVRRVDLANNRNNNRAFPYGDLADLIMLEERIDGRSEQITTNSCTSLIGAPGFTQNDPGFGDAGRGLLGTAEEDWLTTRLRSSTARWKFIGQGVMFAQLKGTPGLKAAGGGCFLNSDQWDGYEPARDRVFNVLSGDDSNAPVSNVAVLTGDIHSSWAADLTPDPNNPAVYAPGSGAGSLAVEFVGTSVSSPGFETLVPPAQIPAITGALMQFNPHFKYVQLTRRGYLLMDVNPRRIVGEYWYVDTVASPSNIETFAAAYEVAVGTNHLTPAVQTPSRTNPPRLAP
jgi:alkaline phosphatase D